MLIVPTKQIHIISRIRQTRERCILEISESLTSGPVTSSSVLRHASIIPHQNSIAVKAHKAISSLSRADNCGWWFSEPRKMAVAPHLLHRDPYEWRRQQISAAADVYGTRKIRVSDELAETMSSNGFRSDSKTEQGWNSKDENVKVILDEGQFFFHVGCEQIHDWFGRTQLSRKYIFISESYAPKIRTRVRIVLPVPRWMTNIGIQMAFDRKFITPWNGTWSQSQSTLIWWHRPWAWKPTPWKETSMTCGQVTTTDRPMPNSPAVKTGNLHSKLSQEYEQRMYR